MRKFLWLFGMCIVLFSCKEKEKNTDDYYKGQISISTDESFLSVTQALGESYEFHYPDAEIKVIAQKEDQGFIDLLNRKVDAVVMSRVLTPKEKSEYERIVDLPLQPANFAGDAVLFIVPKNSPRQKISMEEIAKELHSDHKNIIFDGTHSSNLNFVAQTLQTKPEDLKFSIIKGNENLIEKIGEYQNKIGVISLNTISRLYSDKAKTLREKIKILPIEKNGKTYTHSFGNLKTMQYPFTRVLYFLTREGHFGMANGFIRFSCTNIGQKVVQKEGLQKYYLYKREVKMY